MIRQQNRFLVLFRGVSGIVVELFVSVLLMGAVFLIGALILRWFSR
jgi:hypothetical protein